MALANGEHQRYVGINVTVAVDAIAAVGASDVGGFAVPVAVGAGIAVGAGHIVGIGPATLLALVSLWLPMRHLLALVSSRLLVLV